MGWLSPQGSWSLPNILTLFRVCLLAPIMVLLFYEGPGPSLAAGFIFIAASVTDLLDGYLARRWRTITDTGRLMDPIADKLLVAVPLIMMTPWGRVPAWAVALLIAREIAVTGLRGLASEGGIALVSSMAAKYKTTFQAVAVAALLIHYERLSIDFHAVGMFFFWIALALTLWSGADYFYRLYRKI